MSARAELAIDWVAPPFAGHLFPIVALAAGLAARGFTRQRVLSTPGACDSVQAQRLEFVPLLAAREHEVSSVANTPARVGFAPWRLLAQLRQNLALCGDIQRELDAVWSRAQPDVVIADFTLPFAGHLAEARGARWWTSMPSPCALETRRGTPSYLGGWIDHGAAWSRLRDRAGCLAVRGTKLALGRLVRHELAALGVPRLYREDGTEVAYSRERILALGAREFEFDRPDWPAAVEFVGPVTASARADAEGAPDAALTPVPGREPSFEPGRVHILVSLGTHLGWAKERAVRATIAAARALPEWRFHFTRGRAGLDAAERDDVALADAPPNWTAYDYVAYDQHLARYDVALIHGGTGVTYACLERGIPMLVWPHDYDQFDHAARVVASGAGRRFRARRLAQDLVALNGGLAPARRPGVRTGGRPGGGPGGLSVERDAAARMGEALRGYDAVSALERRLGALVGEAPLEPRPIPRTAL
ncbi:MAG: glycosyl transferase [Planctomycetota bacterium]